MSQSAPLRPIPTLASVTRLAKIPAADGSGEPAHGPISSPVPNGVSRLPSLLLPQKRVSPREDVRKSDVVLRALFVGAILLAVGVLVSRAFPFEMGAPPTPSAAGSFSAARVAETRSGGHCDGSDLQSRMCEVAWQGSLVGGF
jgi:hypothetical protein